jgi:hypothetical protein
MYIQISGFLMSLVTLPVFEVYDYHSKNDNNSECIYIQLYQYIHFYFYIPTPYPWFCSRRIRNVSKFVRPILNRTLGVTFTPGESFGEAVIIDIIKGNRRTRMLSASNDKFVKRTPTEVFYDQKELCPRIYTIFYDQSEQRPPIIHV